MKCLVISHSKILGDIYGVDDLSRLPDEEFFVIDMDSLLRGKPNFQIYSIISRYVEFNLMSYPFKETDLVDMIISGASRVVVNHTISDEKLKTFMDISDQIIMHYNSSFEALAFMKKGGNFLLGCTPLSEGTQNKIFYYGMSLPGSNYIPLEGFPEELRYDC
ncbi:MAG: hypothetical protein ACYDAO_09700 [Thermoplasmataceae archaeon]